MCVWPPEVLVAHKSHMGSALSGAAAHACLFLFEKFRPQHCRRYVLGTTRPGLSLLWHLVTKKLPLAACCCSCILSLEGGKCFTCFWHLKMLLVLLHTQSGRHVCECVSNLCSLCWSTPYTAVSCWQWNCAWGVFIVLMMHGSRKGGADKFAKCFKCIQITLQCSGSTRLMGSSCASAAGSYYRVQAIGKC